jgi:homogentisate 1,2-dioxygenase
MTPHGPDETSFTRASTVDLVPERQTDTLAFMFETRFILRPTKFALECASLQRDYWRCWQGIGKRFNAE